MQIALFSDPKLKKTLERDYGLVKKKTCIIRENMKQRVEDEMINEHFTAMRINSVLSRDRHYVDRFSMPQDSHFIVEKLGASTTSYKYNYEISAKKCLALALSEISGCEISNILTIKDYERISEILIGLDIDNMDISLGVFMNVDPKLDDFLRSIEFDRNIDFMRFLLSAILGKVTEILKYSGLYIQRENDNCVFKSINDGSIIITSAQPLDLDSLEVVTQSNQRMCLEVSCMEV